MGKKKPVTRKKAKKILKDGAVRGKKLSERQEGFFGLIAGGGTPTKTKHKKKKKKK